MVVSTCTGYDANLQYLKGEKPIRTTLKPVSVINLVACPYLEYINMFFAGCLEQCHIYYIPTCNSTKEYICLCMRM